MTQWIAAVTLVLSSVVGCGSETAILVEVELRDLQVPQQVNTLSFRLVEADAIVAERAFPLLADAGPPSLTMTSAEAAPDTMELTVLALRNQTIIAISRQQSITFIDGEVRVVSVPICAGLCPPE